MEQNNRVIGRVLSVDNFRVFIKIDENLNGAYKSGVNDIYEIARINSYLIIPVGSDRIVAIITRVTMKEEAEFDRELTTISLPVSARYISATMLGTIAKKNGNDIFLQGVYSFPALDNPVWYVTETDLQQIFDDKLSRDINYEKDFYLPIGSAPAFPDYRVKICPDQFFVKHAAILGNTGSGKTCTLTSILRNLFKFQYNGYQYLQNAHIIIFDTNGEYKDAFISPDYNEELNRINAYYYGGEEQVKVPYWMMNWGDFKSLLKPGDGVQAPILNRAIGFAKNEQESIDKHLFPIFYITRLEDLICQLQKPAEEAWKIKNYESVISSFKDSNLVLPTGEKLADILNDLPKKESKDYSVDNPKLILSIIERLQSFINGMRSFNMAFQIISEQNIDIPTWFSYQELCGRFIDAAIEQDASTSNAKVQEYLSTLRLRMNSFLNDKRIAVPLMLKDTNEANKNILPQFLAFLLGDFNRYYGQSNTPPDNFIHQYNTKNGNKTANTNQITVIDVSMLPFEVLETITALLGRIILDFVSYFLPEQRGKYPLVIVLEEAQNYIAEAKDSIAKIIFERIAREGRKYGISLVVSSQRPSELSKTVLSQCNSFVIHRLQNPEDQKYIRGLVSSASSDILDQLPIIPQQHAIITGDCVRTPVLVRIDDVRPTPNSHNPKYIENWLFEKQIPYEDICKRWFGLSSKNNQNS